MINISVYHSKIYKSRKFHKMNSMDINNLLNPVHKKFRRSFFDKSTVSLLKHWLFTHHYYPYPNLNEKRWLSMNTGLTIYQITLWFINARKRVLVPYLTKKREPRLCNL